MATIRPYDQADLGRVLALWDGQVDVDDALQVISSANGVALVADVDGTLGGIALGALEGTEGRIVRVTAADGEIAELLLDALEKALAHHGARTVVGDGGLRDRLGARGILPVGPPDADAREAIWTRYVDEITDEDVDIAALVAASELFTPADIEFAARKAAQRAFEREHFGGAGHRARTEDFLACIAETRPSLSEEIVAGFDADVREFARD